MQKTVLPFGKFSFLIVEGVTGEFTEQVSTSVPNSAFAPFDTPVLLVGECLPQALLMRLAPPYILPPHFTMAENKTGCGSPVLTVISERS